MTGQLLSVRQTAEKLNRTPQTVRRYIQQGDLFAVRAGNAFRIPEAALTEYLRTHGASFGWQPE